MGKLNHYQASAFDNIEQNLLEVIAEFLDSETVIIDEAVAGFVDPAKKEESELHIRMAKAAMVEYKKTMGVCDG